MTIRQTLAIIASIIVFGAATLGVVYQVTDPKSAVEENSSVYGDNAANVALDDAAVQKDFLVDYEQTTQEEISETPVVTEPEKKPSTVVTPENGSLNAIAVNELQKQYIYPEVMVYDNYEIVVNPNGTKIINSANRKALVSFSDEYKVHFIDGNTVYITRAVYEPGVSVNPEFRYDESGKEIAGWENYFTSEVIKYNIATGEKEILFRTNYFADIRHVDGDNLYYLDIAEEQKGFFGGFEKGDPEKQLVEYNLVKGTKKVLANDVIMTELVENGGKKYIVYLSSDYSVHSVDTSTARVYNFESNASFKGCFNGRVVYEVLPEGFFEGAVTEGTYTVRVMSCNPDGSGKMLLGEVECNARISNYFWGDLPDNYILCSMGENYEGSFEVYFFNVETNEFLQMDYENYDNFLVGDGLWICYLEDEYEGVTTVYKINDNLECEKMFDVYDDIHEMKPEYITENGFYCADDAGMWQFYEFPSAIR